MFFRGRTVRVSSRSNSVSRGGYILLFRSGFLACNYIGLDHFTAWRTVPITWHLSPTRSPVKTKFSSSIGNIDKNMHDVMPQTLSTAAFRNKSPHLVATLSAVHSSTTSCKFLAGLVSKFIDTRTVIKKHTSLTASTASTAKAAARAAFAATNRRLLFVATPTAQIQGEVLNWKPSNSSGNSSVSGKLIQKRRSLGTLLFRPASPFFGDVSFLEVLVVSVSHAAKGLQNSVDAAVGPKSISRQARHQCTLAQTLQSASDNGSRMKLSHGKSWRKPYYEPKLIKNLRSNCSVLDNPDKNQNHNTPPV